jgi:hypothetical protein
MEYAPIADERAALAHEWRISSSTRSHPFRRHHRALPRRRGDSRGPIRSELRKPRSSGNSCRCSAAPPAATWAYSRSSTPVVDFPALPRRGSAPLGHHLEGGGDPGSLRSGGDPPRLVFKIQYDREAEASATCVCIRAASSPAPSSTT